MRTLAAAISQCGLPYVVSEEICVFVYCTSMQDLAAHVIKQLRRTDGPSALCILASGVEKKACVWADFVDAIPQFTVEITSTVGIRTCYTSDSLQSVAELLCCTVLSTCCNGGKAVSIHTRGTPHPSSFTKASLFATKVVTSRGDCVDALHVLLCRCL